MSEHDHEPLDLIPSVAASELAWISESEMIEVDRIMIEDLHIELMQMMENAGRALANVVRTLSSPGRVIVAAGSGGNGGGGLVAARHLANAGIDVAITTTRAKADMSPVAAHQLDILERIGVPAVSTARDAEVLIDAVIGYSLRGAPRGASEALIVEAASAGAVVSLDTPSGLDVTTGATPGVAVRADATVTLALPKTSLRSSPLVGDLYLADISVPPNVTATFGANAPRFGRSGLLRIDRNQVDR